MKITVTAQKPANKKYVEVRFSEDISATRFGLRGGKQILEMKSPSVKECNNRKWLLFVRSIISELHKQEITHATIMWQHVTVCKNLSGDLGQLFAENVLMADYAFDTYKTKTKDTPKKLVELMIITATQNLSALKKQVNKGVLIGTAVNECRELANIPGNDMTPKMLVRGAKKMMRGTKIRARVLGEAQMRKQKMGGVLAVGQGSGHESQFLILEYTGARHKKTKPTVLVGKGITFDTGGIDTKPHPSGLEMNMDMSGAAAVITTIVLAARLGIKKNIVALAPMAENMPGGKSFKPGDIIRMMDGTSVEIGHTDAEGRVVLGDALAYAKKYQPHTVIDVATLTGAAVVALGERATGLFTRDDALAEKTLACAEASGDYAWRLPLWEEYEKEMVGNNADLSTIKRKGKPGAGGAITAAIFLHHFAQDFKSWMHLDIAPTMTATVDEHLTHGAKGAPVRLLITLLEK